MIPRIIHQLWIPPYGEEKSDSSQVPTDIAKNINTWREFHPEADLHVWNIKELDGFLKDFHGIPLLEIIARCRFPTMQANLIRLALVYEYGGYWSDLKNRVIASFLDKIEHEELVLCEHQPMPEEKAKGYLTNSFFGAKPGNKFIKLCLDQAVKNIDIRMEGSLSKVTGLVLMNDRYKSSSVPEEIKNSFVLEREIVWKLYMNRKSASYQSGGRHWTALQKDVSLYL